MRATAAAFACLTMLAVPAVGAAQVCKAWGPAEAFGQLDTKLVNEASGLDVSARFKGRLYHNNDSGDDLRFYISDLKGDHAKAVDVKGPKPRDIEELSLGPCGRETCLYLGDIGDNPAKRDEVRFTLVREKKNFDKSVKPLRVVRARYPNGAHNAEAFAVHPNGDLFLVTKPADAVMTKPVPAKVYKLTAAQLRNEDAVQTFEKIGEIDLPTFMGKAPFPASISTGLDISADGKRAILLTYLAAVELGFDLAQGLPKDWVEGVNYQVVKLDPFPQQEAIAWAPGDKGFLYDTELARGSKDAPIRRVLCQD